MSNQNKQPVVARKVKTSRIEVHVLAAGANDGWPVVFIHGNCSDSRFWRTTMAVLPSRFRALAPDLRGYGQTEPAPIDATRGLSDFTEDIHALLASEGIAGATAGRKPLLVGHSVGGAVAMQYAIEHPHQVGGLVLVAPMSPYGFGGTRGPEGRPCWPDFAGSGGGTASPEFVQRIVAQDRGSEGVVAPRNVLTQGYMKPPFRPENEEELLDSLLSTRIAEKHYPGDSVASPNWPGVAPGAWGMNNALSPKYVNLQAFAELPAKPPVLWVRGADDAIVSDTSLFDLGYLGQLGAVPGWPGAEVYPAQPMVTQMRAVLDRYQANGGSYREEVFAGCGHSPQIEKPEAFNELCFSFLAACSG